METLSEATRRILGLIAEGRSYDQILQQHPELTYFDIFAAAREALELGQSASTSVKVAASPAGPPIMLTVESLTAEEPSPPEQPTRTTEEPTAEPTEPEPRRVSFVERARAKHGRAFTRWSREEDARLEQLFRDGTPRSELVHLLDRHDGAIERRLQKLGLIEAPEEPPPSRQRARRTAKPEMPPEPSTPQRHAETPVEVERPTIPGWDLFRDRLTEDTVTP